MKLLSTKRRQHDSEILAKRASQVQRGAARAAVLGVNDGLVSTLCIVVAVAAAGAGNQAVLIAGFAGLVAGAISMAAGEWISVKSQVELFQGILSDLKAMVRDDRQLLQEKLAESFSKTGIKKVTASKAAEEVAAHDEHLFDVYASQVVGMNPDELGSPWVAAGSSFALFTLGALAPLAPWFFTGGSTAIFLAILFTAIGGLLVGGYVAVSSGKSVAYGAFRQLFIVLLAAVVTYGVGHLFGASVV